MLDLVFLLFLAFWSIGVGRAIVRRLTPLPSEAIEAAALALGVGLGALSLATLALGLTGWMTWTGMAVVLGLGLIVVLGEYRIDRLGIVGGIPGRSFRISGWLDAGFDLALAVILVGTLLKALTPVTDGDALCYHLQVPKVFLQNQGVTFDPDLHETVYPLNTELLYALGLAFRGPIACRLIQWLFGVLLALSVAALARPVLGARARWASTIVLGVPAISNGMGAPLNDVALAASCNVALLGCLRWHDRPTTGNAMLAGILAGLAVGVKYPALVWVALLSAFLFASGVWKLFARQSGEASPRERFGSLMRQLAAYGVAVLLVGGVWPLRCYLHTSNPVFPFFRDIFGTGLDVVLDPIKRPLDVNPWNLLTAIVPLTLQPDRFDSLAHQFGPVFLMILPGIVFFRPGRRLLIPLVLAFGFLVACLTQRQSMRFLLAALGPFSVAVAWLVGQWSRRGRAGEWLVGLVLLLVLAEAGLALSRVRQGWTVLLGRESVAAFLERREPTWRVGQWIDRNLPADARIIGQDHRGFYIPRPYTMELAHRRRTGLGSRGESGPQVLDQLRRRGYTHLLLCPPIPEDAVEFDPTLSRLLDAWTSRHPPIYAERLTDADGIIRDYRIYEL